MLPDNFFPTASSAHSHRHPRHSTVFKVNIPSVVVSPGLIPSFSQIYLIILSLPFSIQGPVWQTSNNICQRVLNYTCCKKWLLHTLQLAEDLKQKPHNPLFRHSASRQILPAPNAIQESQRFSVFLQDNAE